MKITINIDEKTDETESFLPLLLTFLYFRASQPIIIYVFYTFPLFFPL